MSTTQTVHDVSNSIERRKGRWHFLSTEQRMAGTFWHGMCSEGQRIFEEVCREENSPLQNLYLHYGEGKCNQCLEAFRPHFFAVTD